MLHYGVTEELEVNDNILFNNVLKDLGINSFDENNILDALFDFENKRIISVFPQRINDLNKYTQISTFYDNRRSKKDFLKIYGFIFDLWICNDTYLLFTNFENDTNYGIYLNKLIAKRKNNIQNFDMFEIKNKKSIYHIVKQCTKEHLFSILYFKGINAIAYISGFDILIISNEQSLNIIEKTANVNGLFLWGN